MEKRNLLNKLVGMLVVLLLPIVALYMYSNQVSVKVVQNEIEQNSRNKLSFFLQQMDNQFKSLIEMLSHVSLEPNVKSFMYIDELQDIYSSFQLKYNIQKYLDIQTQSREWQPSITLYSLQANEIVSSHSSYHYKDIFTESVKDDSLFFEWFYDKDSNSKIAPAFVWRTKEPYSVSSINELQLAGEIRVDGSNVIHMLENFKANGSGDPFFYQIGQNPLTTRSANHLLQSEVVEQLKQQDLSGSGTLLASLQGERYMINYAQSATVGWFLVEYVPLETVLTPITVSRNWFWISLAVLLIMSIIACSIIYRNMQVPIMKLVSAAKRMRMGDYSVRLKRQKSREFGYLFDQFNLMAEQIQELIDNVYREQIRSREATLKQLQSQINPHFLYNCLFFIKNMTRLGERDAVMAMAVKLGEYYRYTTHVEQQEAGMRAEIQLITNYLSIQKMRMKRLTFDISVPEEMMQVIVPRLLLQPVVENSVIHGIEPKEGPATILIQGSYARTEDITSYSIIVEDNGVGMDEHQLAQLRERLRDEHGSDEGCGLRNVHQRLIHRFGTDSGLVLESSALGGLRVTMRWTERDHDSV